MYLVVAQSSQLVLGWSEVLGFAGTILVALVGAFVGIAKMIDGQYETIMEGLQDARDFYKDEYEDLRSDFRELSKNQTKLEGRHEILRSDHKDLKGQHKKLKRSHFRLFEYYERLYEDHNETMDSDQSIEHPHPEDLETPDPPKGGYFEEGA